MPTTTIHGSVVDVDDEGFMTNYDQWNEEIGADLAAAIEVEMTRTEEEASEAEMAATSMWAVPA